MTLRNTLAGALVGGLLVVGLPFGSAAMAQGNHQRGGAQLGGGGQQWQQGWNEAQHNSYYGSSSDSYAPRSGWRWQQPQRCWVERIPGSGLGPQRVCR